MNLIQVNNPNQMADSIPSLIAQKVFPNSNTAQRWAAIANLGASLATGPTALGKEAVEASLRGVVAESVIQGVSKLSKGNDIIGSVDKSAAAGGITPGSKPAGCP